MKKQIDLLNEYLSDIAVLNVKLHNLHWNVVGQTFVQAHEHLESLYDDLFEKLDAVAERVKMLGYYPLSSLASYLENSEIKELQSKDVSVSESFNTVLNDYQVLLNKALEVRQSADANDDFTTVALMEEHVAGYQKELWFIKSMLK